MSDARWSGLLVGVVLVAACGGEGGGPAVTRVDSAGIELVVNQSMDAPEWRLAETPSLDLGTLDEEGPEQFFRVTDATFLADGTVAVVNAGTQEVRLFTRAGEHVRSFGRAGDGPGEFQRPTEIAQLRADTVLVWDTGLRRASFFGTSGAFARSFQLPEGILNPLLIGVQDDGRMVFGGPWFDLGPGTSNGKIYAHYELVGADGAVIDSLPTQLWSTFQSVGEGMLATPLFEPSTTAAGDADGYWIARRDREEVRHYRLDGTVSRIVRWIGGDRSVTQADVDQFIQNAVANQDDPQRQADMRNNFRQRGWNGSFPAHGPILTDRTGALWIQEYERPNHVGPMRWMVFDPTGALAGYASVPEALTMLEVGEDYVLGVYRDDLDIEHVRMYGLERTQSQEGP